VQPHTQGYRTSCGGSGTVVAKKNVDFADGFRFSGQEPVNRGGKANGRGAFEVQCAQAIRAAYYLDLAARDYILADGAGFFLPVRARAIVVTKQTPQCIQGETKV
jgi:hypothetical protein